MNHLRPFASRMLRLGSWSQESSVGPASAAGCCDVRLFPEDASVMRDIITRDESDGEADERAVKGG